MIRAATEDDVDAIAAIHVAAFRAAHGALLPPERVARMTAERSATAWRSLLADAAVLVSTVDDGTIAGVAGAGRARDDDATRSTGEIYAIYVDPERWGAGHGGGLDATVRERLAAAGFDAATLWVLERNDQARRFYEHRGWRADGERRDDDGAPIVRYRVMLA